MKQRSRLGRGLSSLIASTEPPVALAASIVEDQSPSLADPPQVTSSLSDVELKSPDARDQIQHLPVAHIAPNPHQPRRQFDEEGLAELAASFKSTGVIQPIIVRFSDGRYELIAGERRWRAAQHAGLDTIPALVRSVDSATQAQMALVENIQREDLNPMDRALAYQSVMEKLGLTQSELAARLGENRTGIAHFLRLLELQPGVQEFIRRNELQLGHAKLLAGVRDGTMQEALAKDTIANGWSVRELERRIEGLSGTTAKAVTKSTSAHLKDVGDTIGKAIGLRVQVAVSGDQGRGRLVIHYGNLEQFEQLMKRLGVNVQE